MEIKNAIRALAALAQESRLAIFRLLVERGPEGLAVGGLGEALAIAPATLSFHLKELYNAGPIQSRQDGRFVIYAADYTAMNGLIDFLTENCCQGAGCAASRASVVAASTRKTRPASKRRTS